MTSNILQNYVYFGCIRLEKKKRKLKCCRKRDFGKIIRSVSKREIITNDH